MSAGQLLRQANQLKRGGKLEEAITLYHQVIEITPNFAWTYYELGDALAKNSQHDEATIAYKRATDINKKQNSVYFSYTLEKLLESHQTRSPEIASLANQGHNCGVAELKKFSELLSALNSQSKVNLLIKNYKEYWQKVPKTEEYKSLNNEIELNLLRLLINKIYPWKDDYFKSKCNLVDKGHILVAAMPP